MNTFTNLPGGLHEREELRLQREADDYTMLVEHKKKEYLVKEAQRKNLQKSIDGVVDKIKIAIPSEEAVKRDLCKKANLKARLVNKKVLLNDTMGNNKGLKVKIDVLRQDLLFAHASIGAMKEQIGVLKKRAQKDHGVALITGMIANSTNNKILA